MPEKRNMLAEHRTELGFGRTLLALERTLMAWIRTDISLITFGFTMFKLLEGMQQVSGSNLSQGGVRNIGLALILLGVGTLIMAMLQFRIAMKKILVFTKSKPQPSISMITGVGLLMVAIAMILNVLGVWKF